MFHFSDIMLIAAIALLVAMVAVLVLSNLWLHRKLNDKNEVIIRDIQENIQLRDQVQHLLSENKNKHQHDNPILI